ncbi:trimethylamine methyltransferase family protein [Chloroflexota bacterium]
MAELTLKLLSDEEKNQIHSTALNLLEGVGLLVEDTEALDLLEEAGAGVDHSAQRVRFPTGLVGTSLEQAPAEVKLYGRDTSQVVHLTSGSVYYSTSGYAVRLYDPRTGQCGEMNRAGLEWITELADGLDHVDIHAVLGTPYDVPSQTNDRYQLAIALTKNTKHIWNTAYGRDGVQDAVNMASAVRGSRQALRDFPLFTLDLTTLSPLQLDGRQASTIIEGARQGIPIGVSPGPSGGATGPVTLAGTLVQAHAEFLGGLVLCQVVQPGIPVIYTHWTRSLDMASGGVAMGGPEFSLLRVANAEMARYCNLPSRGGGLMADSKTPDAQMGAEKLLNCLMASLAGLNVVAGVGQTDFINTVRPEQMFIDNEIIGIVKRMCRGMEVNQDTIAQDAISEVGPGGNYLSAEHTLAHFRSELWFPTLWDRKTWSVWEEEGAKDVAARATEQVASSSHRVPPLDPGVEAAIWEVVTAADQRLA